MACISFLALHCTHQMLSTKLLGSENNMIIIQYPLISQQNFAYHKHALQPRVILKCAISVINCTSQGHSHYSVVTVADQYAIGIV